MTQITKLTNKRYFKAPSPAPSMRFSQPSETASNALVNTEATNVKISGTAIQIMTNANICATVMESVTVGHNFTASEVYKAFAANSPTINPRMEASCRIKPFINPTITPAPRAISMIISMVVILCKTKTETRSCNHSVPPYIFSFVRIIKFASLLLLRKFQSYHLPSNRCS